MSKFCLNCGTELADSAAVCTGCGAAQEVAAAETAAPAAEKKGNPVVNEMLGTAKEAGTAVLKAVGEKKKLFITIGGVVLGVIVLIMLFSLIFGGGGTKGAVESFMRSSMMYDAGQVERAVPEAVWEFIEDKYEIDAKDAQAFLKDYHDDLIELAYSKELGENVSLSFTIVEENKLSDKKLNDLKDTLKESFDIPAKSISEAIEVEVEYKMSGSDDDKEDDGELTLVKIGSKYYCVEAMSWAVSYASTIASEKEDPDAYKEQMEAMLEALKED